MSDVSGVGNNPYNQLGHVDQAAKKEAEELQVKHVDKAVDKIADKVRDEVKIVTVVEAEETGVPDKLYDETDRNRDGKVDRVEQGQAEAQARQDELIKDKAKAESAAQNTSGLEETPAGGGGETRGTEAEAAYQQNREPQARGQEAGKPEDLGPTEKTFAKKVDVKA